MFHPLPAPTHEELAEVITRVRSRSVAWLIRKGYAAAASHAALSQETAPQTPLDACAAVAMQRGDVRALRDSPDAELSGSVVVEPPAAVEGARNDLTSWPAIQSFPLCT